MPETISPGNGACTIGSLLREAREKRGIALDEASGVTRIGKNYLLALEEDSFDKLPNSAYVKGFLRVYASYLGLSGDEIISRYETAHSEHNPPTGEVQPAPARHRAPVGYPDRRTRWLVPSFLLLLVFVTAYLTGRSDVEREQPVQPPLQEKSAAPQHPVQPRLSSALKPVQPATVPQQPPQELQEPSAVASPVKGVILKLKVNQDCWLNITIDGILSQQYDLKSGDLIEWKGEKSFALDIGNAGGVEAEFNGKALPPFGELDKPAHIMLTGETPAE